MAPWSGSTSPSTSPSPIRPWSDGMDGLASERSHPVEYAAFALNECRCVDMRCTACGGADSLSHPGARGGLDARLGASLDPREDVSPGSHREEPQERT